MSLTPRPFSVRLASHILDANLQAYYTQILEVADGVAIAYSPDNKLTIFFDTNHWTAADDLATKVYPEYYQLGYFLAEVSGELMPELRASAVRYAHTKLESTGASWYEKCRIKVLGAYILEYLTDTPPATEPETFTV